MTPMEIFDAARRVDHATREALRALGWDDCRMQMMKPSARARAIAESQQADSFYISGRGFLNPR